MLVDFDLFSFLWIVFNLAAIGAVMYVLNLIFKK